MNKLGTSLFNFNQDHVKDHENNYLFFQAGRKISILEENKNWGWGKIDENFGFFPLLYLCIQQETLDSQLIENNSMKRGDRNSNKEMMIFQSSDNFSRIMVFFLFRFSILFFIF